MQAHCIISPLHKAKLSRFTLSTIGMQLLCIFVSVYTALRTYAMHAFYFVHWIVCVVHFTRFVFFSPLQAALIYLPSFYAFATFQPIFLRRCHSHWLYKCHCYCLLSTIPIFAHNTAQRIRGFVPSYLCIHFCTHSTSVFLLTHTKTWWNGVFQPKCMHTMSEQEKCCSTNLEKKMENELRDWMGTVSAKETRKEKESKQSVKKENNESTARTTKYSEIEEWRNALHVMHFLHFQFNCSSFMFENVLWHLNARTFEILSIQITWCKINFYYHYFGNHFSHFSPTPHPSHRIAFA